MKTTKKNHITLAAAPAVSSEFEARVKHAREVLAKEIPTLGDSDALTLADALKAIGREGTLKYPADEFICDLLESYRIGKLTPDEAQRCLDMFTGQFEEMRQASTEFIARYGRTA